MINILLVEDQTLVREGLKMLLETDEQLKAKGTVKTALDALKLLEATPIDVILIDSNVTDMDGIALLDRIKTRFFNTKVIMLSDKDDKRYIADVFRHNADGYLLKDVNAQELTFAVKFVFNNYKYVSAGLSMTFVNHLVDKDPSSDSFMPSTQFSSREIEVLQLMAQGYTNAEISERLFLSKRTVEGHRQNLLEKSGSKNSAALVRMGVLNGLIQ